MTHRIGSLTREFSRPRYACAREATVARPMTITDARQIKLLLDGDFDTLIACYLRPQSVGDVATSFPALNFEQVYYRTRRLAAAGLLRVVEEIPRDGRPIKRYQSVAAQFEISIEHVPAHWLEARSAAVDARLRSSLAAAYRTLATGVRVDCCIDVDGTPEFTQSINTDGTLDEVCVSTHYIRLTQKQAREVKEKTAEFVRNLIADLPEAGTNAGEQQYFLRTMFAPYRPEV